MLTPEQRSLRARIAGHALHAQRDSREVTAPARAAFLSRFEREVDPDGVLTPEERARRAEHAKKAYFVRLAYASSRARQKKALRDRAPATDRRSVPALFSSPAAADQAEPQTDPPEEPSASRTSAGRDCLVSGRNSLPRRVR